MQEYKVPVFHQSVVTVKKYFNEIEGHMYGLI